MYSEKEVFTRLQVYHRFILQYSLSAHNLCVPKPLVQAKSTRAKKVNWTNSQRVLELLSPQTPSFYQIPSDLNRLLEQFRIFMKGQLSLCKSTADSNFYLVGKFLREVENPVTREVVAGYLLKIQNTSTRSNYLKALKHFFRDFLGNNIVSSFKLPLPNENPTPCPTDEAVRLVYNNLEYDRDKLIYSLAATTGLRRGEILNLKRKPRFKLLFRS